MNKKGILNIHWLAIIFAFFVAIGTFFYYLIISQNQPLGDYIGDFQLNLIRNFQTGDDVLLYIDQSAKYTLQRTIFGLASNGGFYSQSECGSFGGANIWAVIEKESKIGKECYPNEDSLNKNFKNYFDNILSDYLASYPDAYIPISYEYELKDNLEIVGKAKENLEIGIAQKGFAPNAAKVTSDSGEIYRQSLTKEIPQILKVPMKSNPDIETIKQYHPEVWSQYAELCKKMGAVDIFGSPPGACKSTLTKCCITSGYRHPAYNKEIGGVGNSPHQYGVAIDIYVGKSLQEQLRWARAASNYFTRVGIYPSQNDIHVDLMPLRGAFQTAYWIGSKGTTLATASNMDQLEKEAIKFA